MFATATKEKGTNLRAATCQLLIGSKFAIVVANNDCKAISLAVIKNRIGANFEMDVDPITPYICQAIVGCDKGRGTSRVTRSLTGRWPRRCQRLRTAQNHEHPRSLESQKKRRQSARRSPSRRRWRFLRWRS
uniref:Ribosomal_L7Ae domain-containing protein n=1 Tax=Mesocestoides corti TaxID=53468 RepID=A0A5K3FQV8_MESCO